jgi:hypothetical protein
MSDIQTAAPAPVPTPEPAATGFFGSIGETLQVVEKAAASVYHKVLATGTAVLDWEAEHPAVGPLIAEGLAYANSVLTRFGIPAGTIELVAGDIVVALKGLAAADATVPSVPTTTTTVTQQVVAEAATLAEKA